MASKYIIRSPRKYKRISAGALYEIHVQNLVANHIEDLFPGYQGGRFEPLIRTISGDVRPDLVIVNEVNSRWSLIEVELGNHNFHAHVLPQMSKLAHCDDGLSFVDKFHALPGVSLPSDRLAEIFATKPSAILVTHGSSMEHNISLSRLGVQCIDLEIFECIEGPNDYILSVEDRRTSLVPTPATATRRDSPWESYWSLDVAIGNLPVSEGQIVVNFDGMVAAWRVARVGDVQFLIHPSDLSVPSSSMIRRVFLDEVTAELHLV